MFLFFICFFFFKQKTAYEMRISDWSSDVCSSDLARWTGQARCDCRWRMARNRGSGPDRHAALPLTGMRRTFSFAASVLGRVTVNTPFLNVAFAWSRSTPLGSPIRRSRSEEHTSELQSLMRIPYAVFCLKKK